MTKDKRKLRAEAMERLRKVNYHSAINIMEAVLGRSRDLGRAPIKRPPLSASDGEPIEVGQTLYGLDDGRAWEVESIDRGHAHAVLGVNRNAETGEVLYRAMRPEWLAHEKPDSPERIAETVRGWRMADPDALAVTISARVLDDLAERIERMGGKA